MIYASMAQKQRWLQIIVNIEALFPKWDVELRTSQAGALGNDRECLIIEERFVVQYDDKNYSVTDLANDKVKILDEKWDLNETSAEIITLVVEAKIRDHIIRNPVPYPSEELDKDILNAD
jgi:hypothetical protein